MAAGKVEFIIEQGATFYRKITWKDSEGTQVNLEGAIVRMVFKDKPGGAVVYTPQITVAPSVGEIEITLTAEQTAAMTEYRLAHELTVEHADGRVTRLLEGTAVISRGLLHEG